MDATLQLSCAIHVIGMILENRYPDRGLITESGRGLATLTDGEDRIVIASYDADYPNMPNFVYTPGATDDFRHHGGVSAWWRQSASRITMVEWNPRRTDIAGIVRSALNACDAGNVEWVD